MITDYTKNTSILTFKEEYCTYLTRQQLIDLCGELFEKNKVSERINKDLEIQIIKLVNHEEN
jgi:hypothetical protein